MNVYTTRLNGMQAHATRKNKLRLIEFEQVLQHCLINFYTWLSQNDTYIYLSIYLAMCSFVWIDWTRVYVCGHESRCAGAGFAIKILEIFCIDFFSNSKTSKSTQNDLQHNVLVFFARRVTFQRTTQTVYILFCFLFSRCVTFETCYSNW